MATQHLAKTKLNPAQQKAVQHPHGPLLIVAGAGTGKTTVITERIKWLIETGQATPSQILALTFTERAAAEMEARVDIALPMGYTQTWIMTFHAFCERILRQEAIQIGLDPDFKVMSEAETYLFLKNHLFELPLNYFRPHSNPIKFLNGLVTHFSRLKDDDISPQAYYTWAQAQKENHPSQPQKAEAEKVRQYIELAKVYLKYEELKVKYSRMDFADLIGNTLKLFRQRPNVLAQYQEKFKYLLIDEFQDTNYAQNHLAILLAGRKQNITAVADDDQAIYRWRGAAVYNVLDFKKHFPQAKVVVLNQNYRSQQYILDHAYQLIQHNNPNRLEVKEIINKKLTAQITYPSAPRQPYLIFTDRVEDEAAAVSQEIAQLIQKGYQPKDIAILIRANKHAEPFTHALNRQAIPYQFLGPGQLFRQPEVRNLIAYLMVLARFDNDEAFYRILNMPIFKFSGRQISELINHARKYNLSLFEAAEQKSPYENLVRLIHHHMDLIPRRSPGQILYYFLRDTHQIVKLANPSSEKDVQRVENISRFFDKIRAFEALNPEARVYELVEYLNFLLAAGESPLASELDWSQENAVNIITVHSAKGLEFPVVFMVNLVNLRFPTTNRREQIPLPEELIKEPSIEGDVHEQEERRLFYVGMTRAKERLYFSGAKFYGDSKRAKKLSGFVKEALGEKISDYLLANNTGNSLSLFEYAGIQFNSSHLDSKHSPAPKHYPVNYLSYSRIADFLICPLHYKLKYILKIPTLPSAALSYGNAIHNTLRDFYREFIIGKPNTTPQLAPLLKLLNKHWSPIGFESKTHEKARYKAAKRQLRAFFEQENWPHIQPIAIEQPFTIKLAPDLKIGGRIDRIDRLDDGSLEIIDYKTGQPQERKSLQKNLQLSIYALATHHRQLFNQPLDKLKLSFYYLENNQKVSLKKTAAELKAAKEEILRLRNEIANSDFSCSHGYICQRNCEYSLFCLEHL